MTTDNHQKLNSGGHSNFVEGIQIYAAIERPEISHDQSNFISSEKKIGAFPKIPYLSYTLSYRQAKGRQVSCDFNFGKQ